MFVIGGCVGLLFRRKLSGMARKNVQLCIEILVRVVLLVVFWYTEKFKPFIRIIQKEEWWLYRYPHSTATAVPTKWLYTSCICAPIITIVVFSGVLDKKRHDAVPAFLAASLAFAINGLITNMVKVTVGRPRPDFFQRCFPSGTAPLGQPSVFNLMCTGDAKLVTEGRKSFPSGHSSYSFVCFGFCCLYMCGKLRCLSPNGRGNTLRFLAVLVPICIATLVAISRTSDYRHHWEDVVVGSLLGFTVAFATYFQYYPALTDNRCDLPLCMMNEEVGKSSFNSSSDGSYLEKVEVLRSDSNVKSM